MAVQELSAVVIGGAFAGVACAQRLAGEAGVRVDPVDRSGHHQFQPLLYQVPDFFHTPGARDHAFPLIHNVMPHVYHDVQIDHAQVIPVDLGSELKAFVAWAEEFYLRPHHRSAALLEPSRIDTPRIDWDRKG